MLLPGVERFVDFLKKNDKRFLFLTNSSERAPRELQQKLARLGLDVDESHFYTSAMSTAAFLKGQCPRRQRIRPSASRVCSARCMTRALP